MSEGVEEAKESEWDHIRQTAMSPDAPSDWPDGVRAISTNGLALIGLNENFELFWDGKPIEIRKPLSFTFWQKVMATLTVVSAVVAASIPAWMVP